MEASEAPMASDTIHIRVDGKLKAEAEVALAGMGLTLPDAVVLLLTRVAADKAMPFEVPGPHGTRPDAAELTEGDGSHEPASTLPLEPLEDWEAEEARLIAAGVLSPPKNPHPMDWDAFWALPRPTVSDEAVREAMDWAKGEF
jgi:DNA-damage-inducible protein J